MNPLSTKKNPTPQTAHDIAVTRSDPKNAGWGKHSVPGKLMMWAKNTPNAAINRTPVSAGKSGTR